MPGRARWSPVRRREPIPTPAAGANFTRLNDSGGTWLLGYLSFRLTTSAAVANRAPVIQLSDGQFTWFRSPAVSVQAASLAVAYQTWPNATPLAIAGGVSVLGWPQDGLPWPPGHTLSSAVGLIDAADQLDQVFMDVWEFPEPLPAHLFPFYASLIEDDQE